MNFVYLLGNIAYRFLMILTITSALFMGTLCLYLKYLSPEATHERLRVMYHKILAASDLDKKPMLIISDSLEVNAATNGEYIIVNQGLIDNMSWDSIAMVLGHELAHVHLGHHDLDIYETNLKGQYHEAVADKLGAFYMMKAGYDICVGREAWKSIRLENGNYIDASHPNYSYRYDALNINCD